MRGGLPKCLSPYAAILLSSLPSVTLLPTRRRYRNCWPLLLLLLALLGGCRTGRGLFEFASARPPVLKSDAISYTQQDSTEAVSLGIAIIKIKPESSNLSRQANVTQSRFSRKNNRRKSAIALCFLGTPGRTLQYLAFKSGRHNNAAFAQQSAFSAVNTAARVPRAGLTTWGDVLKGLGILLAIGGQICGWLGLSVALILLLIGCFIGLFGALKNDELP